ncbi:MAG TPA: hypothetical protein VKU41_07705 [Polyangiaceae bacterium]|nr:hypothetical protein [Polyangiaceae bacterium]
MFRRLFVGLVVGLVVGGLIAAGLIAGLHVEVFGGAGGSVLAYASAGVAGSLTGLVAGKPIWASEAKIEAGLKALFGALVAAGAMFALRRWGGAFAPDLRFMSAGGPAPIGDLPAASLPAIGAALGALFEVDNTGGDGPPPRARVKVRADGFAKAGAAASGDDGVEEADVPPGRMKR